MALATTFLRGLAAAYIALAAALPAHAADMIVGDGYDGSVCGEERVMKRVQRNFRHQVTHVPNLRDVDIVEMRGVHLNRHEPAGPDSPIARHYCHATAMLSDGDHRQVWYLIEEGQGFASIGDNVEFCVAGFDRWYVYNSPWCRVLR